MGTLHESPLAELVTALQQQFQIDNFVETGTHMGHATAWAARRFARVWTIEIRADFQAQARRLIGEPHNV
jgi:protein-L-isoaspartate O-methyltransferase